MFELYFWDVIVDVLESPFVEGELAVEDAVLLLGLGVTI